MLQLTTKVWSGKHQGRFCVGRAGRWQLGTRRRSNGKWRGSVCGFVSAVLVVRWSNSSTFLRGFDGSVQWLGIAIARAGFWWSERALPALPLRRVLCKSTARIGEEAA